MGEDDEEDGEGRGGFVNTRTRYRIPKVVDGVYKRSLEAALAPQSCIYQPCHPTCWSFDHTGDSFICFA